MFGSPTGTFIRPPGSPVIIGDFRVTATFAEHIADGRGPGIDLGNGKCGDPILAMADGTVTFSALIGAAKVVRIAHPQLGAYETGYAHLATIETKKGLTVKRGQRIGTLGTTGATACHLHWGTRLNGVEIDGWPLLDQQQEGDMDPSFSPKPNATVTVNKGARHRTAPTTADPANIAIGSDPGGPIPPNSARPLGFPLMGTVVGQAINGNTIWYAYWRPETLKVYYLHTSTCGPETPWEATTPADCAAEVKAATDPLNARIAAIKAKVAAGAGDIADD